MLAAAGLAIAACVSEPTVSLAALTMAIMGTLAFQATFWAVPATFLTADRRRPGSR